MWPVEAKPASDVERQNDPVANFNTADGLADFFDYTHNLVADYGSRIKRGASVYMWRSLPQIPLVARAAEHRSET